MDEGYLGYWLRVIWVHVNAGYDGWLIGFWGILQRGYLGQRDGMGIRVMGLMILEC